MQHIPVTIAAGFDGTTKTALREALRSSPDSIVFRVESAFHGHGDRITGHHAVNRDWSLEVHRDSASWAVIEFGVDEANQLRAVVR